MFITHKYAVMMLGVLIELPVLDAVVDDLRVNAAAPQICKNTPVVGVSGREGILILLIILQQYWYLNI